MKRSRLIAGMASAVLAASVLAMPVSAAAAPGGNYNTPPADGTNGVATITKYLLMDTEAYAPTVTMTYTLAKDSTNIGTAASADEYNVYEGIMTGVDIDGTVITSEADGTATISFTKDSAKKNDSTADGLTDTFDATAQKYVTDSFNIDFKNVSFPEPGIYRYTITESCDVAQVTNIDKVTRTIDVQISDNSDGEGTAADQKKLKIDSVTVYGDVVTAKDKDTVNTAAGTKTSAFNNLYTSHDLTLNKTVTGNQGSKDKYFAFTVSISGAGADTRLDVVLDNADAELKKTAKINQSITADSNPNVLYTNASGSVEQVFYLMHGQEIKINGLPDGAKYTITETVGEYTARADISGDTDAAADAGIATNGIVSDQTTGIKTDTTVAYTNNKEGTIPTGVILSVAAPAVIGIAVVGGLIVLSVKKKRSEAEE